MTSYLNNGYDVMNCFAKFEKVLPSSITMPSFMAVGSQMPEFNWGPPPHNSQNTPYISELKSNIFSQACRHMSSKVVKMS